MQMQNVVGGGNVTIRMMAGVFASLAAIAGCTHKGRDQNKPISEYPEARAYADCLDQKARQLAPAEGGPLELGIIAADACRSLRQELATAMSGGSRVFVAEFMRSGESTAASMAAERIITIRSRR